ncbi:hypothetical protein [Enterococcus hirae]|uniref:hypothetical protein n=1 Tax=Enterococcus hirae TaxID=1354 RepID=UPI0019EBBECC|nr:hypothetical protein [Enterococcus hirae]EMF0076941.1 hypothetical protein [Enterococcus hirae]EMF0222852.1 hypothetical protein [Enterococcus hirae]MCO5509106.1 hypothetical protein [Enterococcus hirae]
MSKQIKHNFFQTFSLSSIWLIFIITSFFAKGQMIHVYFLWHVMGVSLVCALVFGVMYDVLWNHLTLKPVSNILIATVGNTVAGLAIFNLLSFKLPLAIYLILNLILHTIAFYLYAKNESKKQARALNKKINNSID